MSAFHQMSAKTSKKAQNHGQITVIILFYMPEELRHYLKAENQMAPLSRFCIAFDLN